MTLWSSLWGCVVRRLAPRDVMDECRTHAAEAFATGKPVSKSAAVLVVLVWIAALAFVGTFIVRVIR